MVEYCCSKFKTYYINYSIIERNHKKKRYYIYAESSKIEDGRNIILNFCPFCGKDLTPGLEVLFEK